MTSACGAAGGSLSLTLRIRTGHRTIDRRAPPQLNRAAEPTLEKKKIMQPSPPIVCDPCDLPPPYIDQSEAEADAVAVYALFDRTWDWEGTKLWS